MAVPCRNPCKDVMFVILIDKSVPTLPSYDRSGTAMRNTSNGQTIWSKRH